MRSASTSAQAAALWSTNLLISLTVLTIINAIGPGPTMWLYAAFNPTIWLYAAFNVAAFVFVWRRMPELTGRSLEQIEQSLRRGRFRPRDFAAVPPTTAEGATDSE